MGTYVHLMLVYEFQYRVQCRGPYVVLLKTEEPIL